jgi:hypothetical protein
MNVSIVGYIGPVVGEDAGSVRVDLRMPGDGHPGPLGGEVETADTRE